MNVSQLLLMSLSACTGPHIFDPTTLGNLASTSDDLAPILRI